MIRVVFYGISSIDRNITLTINLILLTVIAMLRQIELQKLSKNVVYIEPPMDINVWSLQNNNENAIYVNILLYLAGLHFVCIVTYHFTNYTLNRLIRSKIEICKLKFIRCCTELFSKKKTVQQFELQENRLHGTPEVSYNYMYSEY